MLVVLIDCRHLILFQKTSSQWKGQEEVLQYTYNTFKLDVGILIDLVHGGACFQDVLPSLELGDGAVICQLDNLSSM